MPTAAQPVGEAEKRPRLALLEPLRIRNFRFFWFGETMSRFGDEFQSIALATVAIALTGKASALASVLMIQNIPNALLLLFGGVVVDRFGARRVMIVTNTMLGLLAAGLVFFAARGALTLAQLYAYAIVVGIIRPFFQPASSSMPPELVPRSNLPAANSLYRMGLDVSRFAAAPLAGAVIAGPGVVSAFALNSVSFLQAAGLETLIRQPASKPKQSGRPGAWQQIVDGLKVVRQDPVLATTVVFIALWYLGFMGAYSVGIAGLAQITLKSGPRGQGILLAAFGLGNLLGSLVAGNVRNFGKVGKMILVSTFLYPPCFAMAALVPRLALCVPFFVMAGAVNAFVYVAIVVLLQSRAAPAVRGRVMSIQALSSYGAYAFSYALAGIVANLWGPRGVMIVLGALIPSISFLFAYSVRDFRSYSIDVR